MKECRCELGKLAAWLKGEYRPEHVAAILGALRDQPANQVRPILEKVVQDTKHSPANRLTAVADLTKILDKTAPADLLESTRSLEDGPVLADTLRRLGNHPNLNAVPVLAGKLASMDAEVRAAAIESLGKLGAKEGLEPSIRLLQDKDARVRRSAAFAAGKLRVKAAREPLLLLMGDADVAVRLASLESLRLLREPRAVPLALKALENRDLEMAALECLSDLGGPEHGGAVAELAKRNPSAETPAAVVRVITTWRDRLGTTPDQLRRGEELDRAVADIHGANGILVRWDASYAVSEKSASKIIEQFG